MEALSHINAVSSAAAVDTVTHTATRLRSQRGRSLAAIYGVVAPDLPGCTSAGKTMDEAYRNSIEAVRLWVEDAEASGEALPHPRALEELREDPDVAAALAEGAAISVVPVLRDSGRSVRANLSLDAGLLEAIDDAADAHGLSRSAFVATAAREKIEHGV
jgi:predicted RNase H-like HicB family nuclease